VLDRPVGVESLGFRDELLNGEIRLGVWGCGYIGLTAAAYFANSGVSVLGHDVVPRVVESVNRGEVWIPNLDKWLGFPIEPLVESRTLQASADWKEMLAPDVRVHLIAIPTEKGSEPWYEPLLDVVGKIAKRKPTVEKPDLVIVESTLTPGRCDQVVVKTLEKQGWTVGKQFLVGVAPRRDWFISPDKDLKSLPRVFGGTTPETTRAMQEVLGIVCDNLVPASNHGTAEMVKSVENMYRHVGIVIAIELAKAYPDLNILEVCRLVGTKWNIPTYFPSVGTGGYCIPLSSKYVLQGSQHPEHLGILNDVIESDSDQPYLVADLISKRIGNRKAGILGLSYKGDLKVHILSPTLRLVDGLRRHGIDVTVHDPYYTKAEIQEIAGTATFNYPRDLRNFDCIVIVPEHRMYSQTPKPVLFSNLRSGQLIIDNIGVWERFRDSFKKNGIDYRRIGDAGWSRT